ncbi:MAG: hypothetical protein ACJA01_000013 [Saprospiraceae bacterium]|jgi:hypothetical protein
MKIKKLNILWIGCLILGLNACNSDMVQPAEGCDVIVATYDSNVKEIIDLTCAYSGCHNGNGSAPGNYSTYAGLINVIQDGKFVSRVIDMQDNPSIGMPPNMEIYPASQQDDLSPDQMEIIQCWIDSGFEE